MASNTSNRTTFSWDDPLSLDGQLTGDERAIRDAAHAYCQERLLPRVQDAFRNDRTNGSRGATIGGTNSPVREAACVCRSAWT